MAELLIKAVDHTHPDPEVDRIGCYKRGMVVRVESDGFAWGAKEGLPKFVLMKMPDATVEEAQALVDAQTEDDDNNPPAEEGEVYRRRRWSVFIDDLPPGQVAKLYQDGELTIPKGQVKQMTRRIRDGAEYPGIES